jgi:threonine dehydratase
VSGGAAGSAPLSLGAVRDAAARLDGVVKRTPVLSSRTLDAAAGARLRLKCECFQRTGSFKFRGASNFVASLGPDERARGVCTISSGNHAQALALAARDQGIAAAILMPEDAPAPKLAATRGYGADVVTYDRYALPQVEAGQRFAAQRGATFVPAYDDPRIAAGAGTALLELVEDTGVPDVLFAPIGGGGGIAGYATVVMELNPAARIYAVESDASAVWSRSLRERRRIEIPVPHHIADGQMLTTPGRYTFEVLQDLVDDVVLVPDAQIVEAMALLFERHKLGVEPSGAIALAAALWGGIELEGCDVAVVVSGGNVGIERFATLMDGRAPRDGDAVSSPGWSSRAR